MPDVDKRVEWMMSSVIGCAFAVAAEMSGLSADDLADPTVAIHLAAVSVWQMDRWQPCHQAVWDNVLELGKAEKARRLAREAIDHPRAAWWFEDMDARRQTWLQAFWEVNESQRAAFGAPPNSMAWARPNNPPDNWERCAQKPGGHVDMSTSTLHAPRLTSQLMTYEERAGDYLCDFPLAWWMMRFSDDVRIFEVHGPDDWHNLCVRYPAPGTEDDRIVPNWSAAARDWDGVHLSFGGLLTAELARFESANGWTMLDTARAELTYWLRPQETEIERMADCREGTVARREGFDPRFPDNPVMAAALSASPLELGGSPDVSVYRK